MKTLLFWGNLGLGEVVAIVLIIIVLIVLIVRALSKED